MVTVFNIENVVDAELAFWYTPLKIGIFLLLIGVLCLIITLVRKIRKKTCRIITDITFYSLAFGVILFLISFPVCFIKTHENHWLIEAYKSESYSTVEGTVKVLHEQPDGGHDKGDIIIIDGTKFEIDYFVLTSGYRETIAHGGALKEGVYAKIYYNGDDILRVDIRKDGWDENK